MGTIEKSMEKTAEVVKKSLWEQAKKLAKKFKRQCNSVGNVITEDYIASVYKANNFSDLVFSDNEKEKRMQQVFCLRYTRKSIAKSVAADLGFEQTNSWKADEEQGGVLIKANDFLKKEIYKDSVYFLFRNYEFFLKEMETFNTQAERVISFKLEAIKLFLKDVEPENNIYIIMDKTWTSTSFTTEEIVTCIFNLLRDGSIEMNEPHDIFKLL